MYINSIGGAVVSEQVIQRIIDETAFSMEVEGLTLPENEKIILRKVLIEDIPFDVQLGRYIENAKRAGGVTSAP